MVSGSLLGSLLASVMVAVAFGHPDEKLFTCCKKVSKDEIKEPILGYRIQESMPPCVTAVIFITENAFYCSHLRTPWVFKKIQELRRAKAKSSTTQAVPSSPPSSSSSFLLSVIASTASPPSSSTRLPSSSSSSPSFLSSTSTIASETSSGTADQ